MKQIMIPLVIAFALVGCGKERFSDPQAFVDHYGREMLTEHFKSGMELMGYGDFEFTNAKVGIDRNMLEYVSAVVSMRPHGKYYRHLPSQPAESILKAWPSNRLSHFTEDAENMAIRQAFRKVRMDETAPVIYGSEAVDMGKVVSPWRTIRIIRLKDGEGVYHPAGEFKRAVRWYDADGDERSEMSGIPSAPFHTGVGGFLSEKAIRQFGALQEGTSEAASACSAYGRHLADLNASIERMNACCATQEIILATSSIRGATNTVPNWIQDRLRDAQASANARVNEVRNQANERTRVAEADVQKAVAYLRKLNSRVRPVERASINAKSNLERNRQHLEQLEAKAARARKVSSRQLSQIESLRMQVNGAGPKSVAEAETALANLKSKISAAEDDLKSRQKTLARTIESCKASVAEAKFEMEKGQSALKAQLECEYGAVRQKSTEDLNAAIAECKRLLGIVK